MHKCSPQFRVWASKTCQMLLVSYSSLCHYKVALPFSPTLFWNCHPSIRHLSIQEFSFSPQSFFALSWLLLLSAASQLPGDTRHPSLSSTQSFLKGHGQCIWRSGAAGHVLVFDPLTFNPGSWMQRLSNLKKEVEEEMERETQNRGKREWESSNLTYIFLLHWNTHCEN